MTRTSIQVSGNTPTFPARWFYGLCRAHPGDEFCSCHRRWRIKADRTGWPDFASASLTSATDARPTRFCRTRHTWFRLNDSTRHYAGRLHAVSAHEQARPATTTRARRCRVHRNLSLVRDDGRRPSWRDRMTGVVRVIWGVDEAEYFCRRGLDWWNRVDWVEEIRLQAQGGCSKFDRRLRSFRLITCLSQVQILSPRITTDSVKQSMSAVEREPDIAGHQAQVSF